jgi:hypothetical protein
MLIKELRGFFSYSQSFFLSNRYKWLDGKFPGTTKRIIFKKLMLDQFLMTPPLLATFFIGEQKPCLNISPVLMTSFHFRYVNFGEKRRHFSRDQRKVYSHICTFLFILATSSIAELPIGATQIPSGVHSNMLIFLGQHPLLGETTKNCRNTAY